MKKKILLQRIIALVLVFVVMLNCFSVSRAERKIETAESGHYTKTFENNTKGGTLYIKNIKGKVLKELKKGDKITYEYPDSKSPDEVYVEAVAEEGYTIDSYTAKWLLDDKEMDTCESVYNMNEKTYERGHFLATAEYDEVFSISFVEENKAESTTNKAVKRVSAKATPDIDNPKVGDTYTGKATITYNGKKNQTYNGTGYITCTSGAFEGDQMTLRNCASGHDYWAPQTGQTGTYTITITKIDKDTGKITCKVEWKNDSHTEGYQNLSGTFSYYHTFTGDITLYKEMGEIEGSFVMSSSLRNQMGLEATFEIYRDKECTKKVSTVKTGKTGQCTLAGIDPGTYHVRETVAPKGFAINPTVFKIKIGSSGKSLTVKDSVLRAKISGVKIDSRSGKPVPTLGLSLAGAVYGVYYDKYCISECNRGVSDSKGNIEFEKEYLAYGTYYIKEITPPKGYDADPTVHKIVVDESLGYHEGSTYRLNDVNFTSVETPQMGKGKVIKKSANESISKDNNCYSLAGCKFQLTNDETKEVVPELLVTNEKGETQEIELAVGAYTVKEVEAPKGFELNEEEVKVNIVKGRTIPVEFTDKPSNDPISVLLKKVDKETGKNVVTGAGELAGAEYTFKYYDGQYTTEKQLEGIVPTRTWILATNERGEINLRSANKVGGDEFYTNNNGQRCIPLGTLTIQETKAPEGYNKDTAMYIWNITSDFKGAIVKSYQTPVSPEPVIRGDIKGVKVSGGDMKRLAGVPFKITALVNGESHVVITDKNGMFDTSSSFNLHSSNTNQGKTSNDGVWFGDIAKLDDNVGALPYGAYRIEELPCEANKDKILIEPFEVAVTKNNVAVDLGTLVNEYIPVPEIGTMATDKNTGLQVTYASEKTTIVDEVDYINLSKGERYVLKGIPMDKATNKPLLVNGKQISVQKTFTAGNTYGVTSLDFTFDSSELKGKETVIFEYLYYKGKLIASHEDINDKKQTIRFASPAIGTSATDKSTGKRTAYISRKSTTIDKVTYRNLIAGEEHTIKGILMDKITQKPLLVNGKQVAAEEIFIPDAAKGHISLEFDYDSSELKDKEIVVFEYLYYKGKLIASHEDINDKKQTIKYISQEEEKKPAKTKKSPKTGDNMNVLGIVVIFIMSVLCGLYLFLKRRKAMKLRKRSRKKNRNEVI